MKAFKVRLEKITLNTVICYVIFEKHIFRYNSFYSNLFLYKIMKVSQKRKIDT